MKKQDTDLLYWRCQVIGWAVASLYWWYTGWTGTGFKVWLAVVYFVLDVVVNILLTHAYRTYVHRHHWNALAPRALIWKLIPAVLVLSTAFMLTVNTRFYIVYRIVAAAPLMDFWQYLQSYGPTTFIGGVRVMTIWVLAYHMYQYAQREIIMVRENARLSVIAKEAQLSNLSAQLNPHFFFNSLNNIKALVIDDPVAARRAIDLLSDLLRTSLYRSTDQLITLQEELALVKDYLELEKLRMEERLQVTFHIDPSLLQIHVPPLSFTDAGGKCHQTWSG